MSIQRKAFTLIELMVTIAIFSLIASISYYSLSASFKKLITIYNQLIVEAKTQQSNPAELEYF